MEEFEKEISDGDDQLDDSCSDSSLAEDAEDKIQHNTNKKRKLDHNDNGGTERDNDANVLGHKEKKTKNDKHKPPTAEELGHLQETENLFKSNLFRLQIEQLLTEINVKQKYKNTFDAWFENFRKFIEDLPEYEIKLSQLTKQNNKNKTNSTMKIHSKTDQNLLLKFIKPERCHTYGLHNINSVIGPELTVDINLVMPKSLFLEKDYLNNRFIVKCEYYLRYIYQKLSKTKLCFNLSFSTKNTLQIIANISKKIQVRLHASPSENTFKLSRFEVDKNNIRESLFESFTDLDNNKLKNCGTPYYNSVLLNELTIASNYNILEAAIKDMKNMQDAIKLLMVWIQRRDLHLNGFSDWLLAQVILYLTNKRKINKHMSSYQVIRNFWVFLSTTNWHESPISICDNVKDEKFKMFLEHFDVVFLDKSGSYNLTSFLYLDVYMKIRSEAALAVQFLDDNRFDSFQALFMIKMSPVVQYDALLRLSDDESFKHIYNEINDALKYKYVGCYQTLVIKRILHFLKKGLHDRMVHIVPLVTESKEQFQEITFGFMLNHITAFKEIERGPASNHPGALAFRQFWGDLAECRRFKDGSVSEAVYFPGTTSQEKRQIFKKMIKFVVTKKLNLEKFEIISDAFENMLILKDYITPFPTGTCEEASGKVIQILDELSKKLQKFALPLEITEVKGVSEVFSYTDVFPPIPTNYKFGGKMTTSRLNNIILKEDAKLGTVPKYVEPIECVIQLGINSKWPNNLDALRQLKIGFFLEISKLFQESGIISNTKPECLDVFYMGLVFRFKLYHPKELSLVKKYTKPDGTIAYKDTDKTIEMNRNLSILPKVISALHGIQSQYPTYGPSTTLIKRWLRSQLIDEFHIPDIVISLLNAALYLTNAPYNTANLPQVAFIRFLQFLANFDGNLQSIVVNFNSEFSKEVLDNLETSFQESRQNYPPLYIVTPFDEGKSLFSKKCTAEVVKRLSVLAKATYDYVLSIETQEPLSVIEELFIPNLEGYNVLIHLKPLMNPKRHLQLQCVNHGTSKIQLEKYDEKQNTKLPVTGFNPVEYYLKELRENYGDLALFFYDAYGGNTIGVLWLPNIFDKKGFKVSNVSGRKLVGNNLVLNTAAIMEDFHIIGNGIVKTIEEL